MKGIVEERLKRYKSQSGASEVSDSDKKRLEAFLEMS